MKSFKEYLKESRINEEGPAGGPAPAGGPGPMGSHGGPAPMPHGGPAGGLGVGFGPAGPRPGAPVHPAPRMGLSFLTPANTTWWTMPIYSLYTDRWPTDPLGRLINRSLTFADLALALDLSISPYDAIGTDNPLIVKKILQLLAKILGKDYDSIHGYMPERGLFNDADDKLAELSRKLGVMLAPRKDLA